MSLDIQSQKLAIETVPLGHWRNAVRLANSGGRPLTVACFGDSNTELASYVSTFKLLLQAHYGDAGFGYHTMGKRIEPLPGAPKISRHGVWTDVDIADDPALPLPAKPWFSADGLWVTTTDPKAQMTIELVTNSSIRLHFQKGPNLGSFEISSDRASGQPEVVDTQADTWSYATVTVIGRSANIRTIAGQVTLFGIDIIRNPELRGGGITHQMGNAWGMAHHFATIETAAYQSFFTTVKPDLLTVMLGTNDMCNGWYPDEFRNELDRLLLKFRLTAPQASILVMSCASCPFDRLQQAKDFDLQAAEAARQANAGFLSIHDLLQTNWPHGSANGMLDDGGLHHTPVGGAAIALEMFKTLGFDLYDKTHAPVRTRSPDVAPRGTTAALHLPREGWPQRPDRHLH